jgi:ABC-type multidrug transport system fused ATPase/permease subunit
MPEKTKTTRKDTKKVLKYFYKKMLPYKGKVLMCILCTIIGSLLAIYTPILTADLTDTISQYGMIERDTMYEDLLQIVFLIGICWAVQVILRNVILYLYTKVTLHGTTDIQDENIYFLTHSSYRFLTDQQS